jgi:hypothetical protein
MRLKLQPDTDIRDQVGTTNAGTAEAENTVNSLEQELKTVSL